MLINTDNLVATCKTYERDKFSAFETLIFQGLQINLLENDSAKFLIFKAVALIFILKF